MSIPELPIGQLVTTLTASDEDRFFRILTWSKTAGDPLNHFTLTPEAGADPLEATLTTNVVLDRETQDR